MSQVEPEKRMSEFLVSCTNDSELGGLYLCCPEARTARRVYNHSCMGVVAFRDCYVLASQASDVGGQQSGGFAASLGHAPHSIVCLDNEFQVLTEASVDEYGMGDLHDVMIHGAELFLVDTLSNRVVVFSISDHFLPGSLPLGTRFIRPVREWVDPITDEADASHVNSICLFRGRVFISVFGRFRSYRGYHSRSEEGLVLDITDGFRPFRSRRKIPDPQIVRSNLADPHTLVAHQNSIFVVESRRRQVLRDWRPLITLPAGYVRGLLHQQDQLWVGRSHSRHSLDIVVGCQAILFNAACEPVWSIDLPAREVYSFASVLPS